jgi:predicted glycogen debranching enzyme
VIAGYPWFGDWGRDTMIALPGLALATGRFAEANQVLRTFARYISQGMLPNRFPDQGEAPEYNTVDATLWLFQAVRAYQAASGDRRLVDDLLPALGDVLDWHERGTCYGIQVDPADGLLRSGAPGAALTWMDVRIDGQPWTPRAGKAVEVNALWHSALCAFAGFLAERDDPRALGYRQRSARVHASFRARFWRPDLGYLADVVDLPGGGDDLALRPNQVLAVSLPDPLLDQRQARAVVQAVGRALWTSNGLRSLAPDHPRYRGAYGGPPQERDRAYHDGTVWSWLLGPYAEAHLRVFGDPAAARAILQPLADHLQDAGLGSVSEILDGDPPHAPRGCPAQAWGVAEALRLWRLLDF